MSTPETPARLTKCKVCRVTMPRDGRALCDPCQAARQKVGERMARQFRKAR